MIEKYVWLIFLVGNCWLDIKKKEISLTSCLFVVMAKLFFMMMGKGLGIRELILGCIPGIFLLGIGFATRRAVGYGDGLIVLVTGWYLGLAETMQILLLGLFCSALLGIVLLLVGKVKRNTPIPFVPFLLLGYIAKEVLL